MFYYFKINNNQLTQWPMGDPGGKLRGNWQQIVLINRIFYTHSQKKQVFFFTKSITTSFIIIVVLLQEFILNENQITFFFLVLRRETYKYFQRIPNIFYYICFNS
eukprot:TRINITY_DN8334_c0_g1_i1.p3 TRINITY_DN8334_c0_g1~~TRINITY_DN8334_c0_g1_i1.p3  ORF type:complete len:105 (-),score=0.62 TRINITY_DN8334_c0_g1_i1:154-468(-)